MAARPGANLLVRGWRNSYLYIAHHRELLLDAFSLPAHVEEATDATMRRLVEGNEELETVSVHVRRGDLSF